MIKVVVLVLASILVGFAVGRRVGTKEGFHIGMAYGVLDMRRRCLEQDRCPICNLEIQLSGVGLPEDGPNLDPGEKPASDIFPVEFDALWLQDVTT